jgi:SulP family sulfate permease
LQRVPIKPATEFVALRSFGGLSKLNMINKIAKNWKSGLTVSLVSMPLSISLAVASGASPSVGIITAIWAGLVASIFGGSNFNVVGPTGALSGIIATYAITHGAGGLATLTLVAGTIILVAYALKLERYLIFIPSSVINGFTLGVALIIAFTQLNSALGLYGLPKHETFFANVIESFQHVQDTSVVTFFTFSIFLIALFVLKKFVPKLPGALLLSPVGIVIGYLSYIKVFSFTLATLGSVFKNISFTFFEYPHFEFSTALLGSGAAVALVAILETMLSAKIADGMTHTKHNERKEMFGLGLANIASGLMGGIPATAALARTSLNIKTGATDKISATLSSLFLLVTSYFFLTYFNYIPMAVIAAILVYVAIQMIERKEFIKFYRYQKSGFWLSLFVAAITFYEDPIVGIVLGAAIGMILFVEKISHGYYNIKLNTFEDGIIQDITGDDSIEIIKEHADILVYSIKGKLVYLNSRSHIQRFEESLGKYNVIILRFRSVYFVDLDGAETIDEIIEIVKARGQEICLTGLNDNVANLLEQVSPQYRALRKSGLVFTKSHEALKHFGINSDKPEI